MLSPLNGSRVLDLSRLLPGPYCTMLLADLGAEVIKIESPLIGDYARMVPAGFGGEALYAAVNRGKKSVGLNYRNPRGREVFLQLAREADVVIETFRPGAVRRWKIDYEAVQAVNPQVIYCSLSGYGQSGPYANRAGHDLNYIAIGGLLALNGALGGPPIPPGVQIADLAGGMLAAIAILATLVGRQRTGQGAYLDVAMLDAVVSWVGPMSGMWLGAGKQPERGQMPLSGQLPCYNVYETADGQHITLGALEPHLWASFCEAVERRDLLARQLDPAAIAEVAALFRGRTRDEWLAHFREVDACVEAVNTLDELLHHPQVQQRGLVAEAAGPGAQIGSPFRFGGESRAARAPNLGEHTTELLNRVGLSDAEIQELETARVVKLQTLRA
ncbi:MAG TPA: CaiB/BaiF CoA-transferase family protein [Anaerolineae bacterium]|nr:CaiB/BaiF CoA-transferase family protein [Anaerolineae bacterium]